MAKMAHSGGPDGGKARVTALSAGAPTEPDAFATAFNVSRETLSRLQIYAELLVTWQKTINLVAPSTLDQIWSRHFIDSAQLLGHAPAGARVWADLGSGAGFPGLVIAIMLAGRSETLNTAGTLNAYQPVTDTAPLRVILVESDARKCAFLAEVVRKTGIGRGMTVEILNRRIENPMTQSSVGPVDVISARALAPLARLLAWSAPLMAPHTVALFLKGRDAESEITAAHERWQFAHQSLPSATDPAGNILLIQNVVEKLEG